MRINLITREVSFSGIIIQLPIKIIKFLRSLILKTKPSTLSSHVQYIH